MHQAGSSERPNTQWILALLPLLPVMLLGVRLWQLSRQNLQTTLLLIQEINPLGLLTALIFSLLWLFPVTLLAIRALSALLRVSIEDEADPERYWLCRIGERIPHWVLVAAVFIGLFTWQLRFLPTLLMLVVTTLALMLRGRRPVRPRLRLVLSVILPGVVGLTAYVCLAPAIAEAVGSADFVTASLLATPPAMTALLTGPVPGWAARVVTQWPAALFSLMPLLAGAVFIDTPVLPFVALQIDVGNDGVQKFTVQHGYVITMDDRMTTVLDRRGRVHFILNDRLYAKALCPTGEEIPVSGITVYGWNVEQTLPDRLSQDGRTDPVDPLCDGHIR